MKRGSGADEKGLEVYWKEVKGSVGYKCSRIESKTYDSIASCTANGQRKVSSTLSAHQHLHLAGPPSLDTVNSHTICISTIHMSD